MRFRQPLLALGLAAIALPQPAVAQPSPAPTRTMIVMDGSGSMWGQIDGVPKLEIARRVVAEVLAGIDPGMSLGLMAYGHRRQGDCGDIELMVDPAPGTAAVISGAVNTMRFQGRTPLTESVRRAAETLRWSEDPATVVLVTDGIETCEADPCALARELESAGVGFTAHVVGFGLSREEGAQVACLAEETGGRYLPADDAASLAEALTQTLAAEPEPEPEPAPEPQPAPVVDEARQGGPWYPGPARQAGLQLWPTGRDLGIVAEPVAEISFPADGTPAQCEAACTADAACRAWQFEPRGSYFVEEARCHLYDSAAEFDYGFEEGFAAGTTPDYAQFIRPFEGSAGDEAAKN